MNWTGGRLRRHSEINPKTRKQVFGNTSAASEGHGLHQITLFNSFAKQQDVEKRRKLKPSTGNTERTVKPPPQVSSNTGTDVPSRPRDRLEQIKRQLLETSDWAAVGAARPIQLAFTPEEELERFGKRRKLTRNDHERLKKITTMPGRPLRRVGSANALHDNTPDITLGTGPLPTGIEYLTDANTNAYYYTRTGSSQPMLLEDESLGSNNGVDVQNPFLSINGTARGARNASSLSRSSSGLHLHDERVMTMNHARIDGETDSLPRQWLEQGRTMEASQFNRSSSIIPEPESAVRRRFTIDDQILGDQAFVDRQGRFLADSSSRVAQFVDQGRVSSERSVEAGRRTYLESPTQRGLGPQTNGPPNNLTRSPVLGQIDQYLPLPRPWGFGPRSRSGSPLGTASRTPTSEHGNIHPLSDIPDGHIPDNANEYLNGHTNEEGGSDGQPDGNYANNDVYRAYFDVFLRRTR